MKNTYILLIFLLFSSTTLAQRSQSRERIESIKIGLITSRLNISTEQAPQFWATYNEYSDKKTSLRRELRKIRVENLESDSTDAQVQKSLQAMLAIRQKEVDLEREYMSKFLKAISPRQLAELYKTEQEFTGLLLKRLESTRGSRPPVRK